MILLLITILLFTTTYNSSAQSTCDSLKMMKESIYGFEPSALSDSLKEIKSEELDRFWEMAKNNPIESSKCLQVLIEEETKDSFFCFDASSLLLRLDTTNKYLPTVVSGLKKCNLKDLQLYSYLHICFYLVHKGIDIGELTTNLISIPDAKIYIPKHFLTLNAIDASIFLLNKMTTTNAENVLITAIKNGNSEAKHNAAILLYFLATDNGDFLLDSLIENEELESSTISLIKKYKNEFFIKLDGTISRAEILESLNNVPYNFEKEFYGFAGNEDLIGSACKQLNKKDIELIREARRNSTPGISDEALYEYFVLTKILMTVRNKN